MKISHISNVSVTATCRIRSCREAVKRHYRHPARWGKHVPASRHSCRTVGMDVRRSASGPPEPLGASWHRACKVRHRTRALFERRKLARRREKGKRMKGITGFITVVAVGFTLGTAFAEDTTP